MLDVTKIMDLIPQRYPILLVDRVEAIEPEKRIVALKNVTINEHYFLGHFPGHPVMPGVLIVEALAQAGALLVVHGGESSFKDKIVYFMTIENAKFRVPVVPGDTISLEVSTLRARGNVWKLKWEALVNGKVVTECSFSAMIMDKTQ